jgi:hypothetical protein
LIPHSIPNLKGAAARRSLFTLEKLGIWSIGVLEYWNFPLPVSFVTSLQHSNPSLIQ